MPSQYKRYTGSPQLSVWLGSTGRCSGSWTTCSRCCRRMPEVLPGGCVPAHASGTHDLAWVHAPDIMPGTGVADAVLTEALMMATQTYAKPHSVQNMTPDQAHVGYPDVRSCLPDAKHTQPHKTPLTLQR